MDGGEGGGVHSVILYRDTLLPSGILNFSNPKKLVLPG
jgi:hypothetical protein